MSTAPLPTLPFDFTNVQVSWGSTSLSGGLESIKVSRAEDTWATHIAADGTVTRTKNNNSMGEVVLTFSQNSPMHDFLSQQAQLDEATGTGIAPISVKDGNGRSLAKAPAAWIKKPADAEYQKEHTDREWAFTCDHLTHFVGGLQ